MSTWDALLHALNGIPRLDGARCRGRAAEFDLEPGSCPEAIERAIHICESCPVLAQCKSYVDSLAPSKRPPGVTAAQLNTYTPRKKAA